LPTHHPKIKERIVRSLDPLEGAEDLERVRGAGRRGDHDLEPGWRAREPLRPAAVLVPIVDRPGGLTVLLTQRTEHLAQHGGQVSFPGGRVEDADGSPIQTALRETREEVGIPDRLVEPVGVLSPYETVTGFLVIPVVGFVADEIEPVLDPREVEAAFEIPLSVVLEDRTYRRGTSSFGGQRRAFYFLAEQPRFVWGATAGMLRDLCRRYHGGTDREFSN
jgi:8-oxo-dGTP pyrophosphatase MutT (NUDIX family)